MTQTTDTQMKTGGTATRLFPYELPIPLWGWLPLAGLELTVSGLFLLSIMRIFIQMLPIRGSEDFFDALSIFGLLIPYLIYPLLMLMTACRQLFRVSKYGLLALGVIVLGAGLAAMVACACEPGPLLTYREDCKWSWVRPVSPAVMFFPFLITGADYLLRHVFCVRYGHAFYTAALMTAFQRSGKEGMNAVLALAVYGGVFAVYLSYILAL